MKIIDIKDYTITIRGRKMKKRTIFISEFDRKRLMQLIAAGFKSKNLDGNHLLELEKELKKGIVFKPREIPRTICAHDENLLK